MSEKQDICEVIGVGSGVWVVVVAIRSSGRVKWITPVRVIAGNR